MQETSKEVLGMYYNTDLSGVTMDANGEIQFVNESQPSTIYRRVIYVAKDGNGTNAKYIIKAMPRAILSEAQEQGWNPETELNYGLTLKATTDPELGYAVKNAFAGPGMKALAEDMGFTVAGV